MKKKTIALIASFSMAGLLLVGCGSSSNSSTSKTPAEVPSATDSETASDESTLSSGNEVTLHLATSLYVESNHQAVFDKLLDAFNKENPNINVEIYGEGYDGFWDDITTEIASGTEGDILQITPSELNSYYALREGGAFLNLDDYISSSSVVTEDGLVGQEECKVDGANVALSNYAYGSAAIFYRKSILEKCGIDPSTISDTDAFVNALKAVTNKGYAGMGIVVGSHTFTWSEWGRFFVRPVSGVFFQNEAGPYSADTINCNSKPVVDMAKWWQNLITNKYVVSGTDKSDAREIFWNGTAAFNMDGPWFIGMTQDHGSDVFNDTGVISLPQVNYEGKKYSPAPVNYPYIMTISSKCAHPDEAWKFIEWMASDEAQKIIAECGMIPSVKSFSESQDYANEYPMQAEMMGFSNSYNLTPNPTTPAFSELESVMNETCQAMFGEDLTDAQSSLDNAAAEMKSIMREWE